MSTQHATQHDQIHPQVSSPSGKEVAAMRAAHGVAVRENEKVFPVFARRLSSGDAKEYINTTNKLTVWLASEKAYYPAARTKIVELIEIALSTFVETFAGHQQVAELAEQLRKLLASVTPFLHLFPEIELRARLSRAVQQTSAVLAPPSANPTAGPAPSSPSVPSVETSPSSESPTITSRVTPQSLMPPVLNSPMVPSMQQSPPIVPSVQHSPPLPRVAPPLTAVSIPSPSAIPKASSSPQVASPSMRSVEPLSSISPTIAHPHEPGQGEPMSPAVPFKPQPRRLYKGELSEELKARDLDWFKSKSNQPGVPSGVDAQAGVVTCPFPGVESPIDASGGEAPSASSSSPKTKTARIVPRRVPRRLPFEIQTARGEGQIVPVSGLLADNSVSFEVVGTVEDIPMDVDAPNPLPQTLPSDAQEVDATQRRSSSLEQQIVPVAPTSSMMESANVAGPLTTTTGLVLSTDRFTTSPTASDHPRSAFIDLNAVPPHSPRLRELENRILPPPVAAIDPPLNLDFRIPPKLPAEPQAGQTNTSHLRFDGRMAVVHVIHARPFTHTHIMDVTLNESLFSNVAKWVNRKAEPNHAPGGICLTLGCYRLPDVFRMMLSEEGGQGARAGEETILKSPCSWPGSNRMTLHVKRDSRDTVVTLSPPLFLTPDQCVDISSLLTVGTNTLEIKQIGDLSEYGLVVHAHHPTRAQLAELEVVKAADERWKRFIETIGVKVGSLGGKVLGGEVVVAVTPGGGGGEGDVGVS